MTSSLSDKALAFEAAVRELSRRYPPRKVPKQYPLSSEYPWRVITVYEEDKHQRMIHDAFYGRVEDVRRECYRSGIPEEELNAIIALIYG